MSCGHNLLRFQKLLKVSEPNYSDKRGQDQGAEEKLVFKSPHFKLSHQVNIFV